MKTKRINFERDNTNIVNGVFVAGVDLSFKDGFVVLTPVNERARPIESRQLRVPSENLEELVDSLLTIAQDNQIIEQNPIYQEVKKNA